MSCDDEMIRDRAVALGHLSYFPGTWDKRFTSAMAAVAASGGSFTAKQAANLERLAWKYRRQLAPRLVPETSPVTPPQEAA